MPAEAMEELADRLRSLDGPVLRVRSGQCLNLRHRRAGCAACADACPTQAIRWSPRLRVEPFDCAECGACAAACRAGALEVPDRVWRSRLARISRAAEEAAAILFACPLHVKRDRTLRARADLVEVPCIGGVAPWELAAAVALGARSVLLLGARCSRCSHRAAGHLAERTVAGARALLAAWGRSEEVRIVSQPPAEAGSGGLLRRLAGFVPRRGAGAEELARRGLAPSELDGTRAEPARSDRTLPQRVPSAQGRLLYFLRRLGEPPADRVATEAPLAHVEITSECTGCGMCAYFCPTGALRSDEREGETEILFRAAACTACGLCARLCYRGAIRLVEARPGAIAAGEESLLWRDRPSTPGERLRQSAGRLFAQGGG